MTRPIRRGLSFPPPYGRDLPLPSDMNSHKGVVFELMMLWLEIAREGLLGEEHREITRKIVDNFFSQLPSEEVDWLEGKDPRWGKFRAVLAKERALQMAQQGGELLKDFLNDPELKKAKDKAKELVEAVVGVGARKESKF